MLVHLGIALLECCPEIVCEEAQSFLLEDERRHGKRGQAGLAWFGPQLTHQLKAAT